MAAQERNFTQAEDVANRPAVCILSHEEGARGTVRAAGPIPRPGLNLVAATDGEPALLQAAMRSAVQRVDPSVAISFDPLVAFRKE